MTNSEVADTDAPVKAGALDTVEVQLRCILVRGKSVLLSLLETFPNREEVAPGEVDEIHIQFLQSQLGNG